MEILKLRPVFKDYIWGGTRLRDDFNYNTDLNPVAEAWVLSDHKDGRNIIDGGTFDGLYLDDLIVKFGKENFLGTNAAAFDYFPILIKLIDAKEKLSIQVHPDNEYARRVENEYGKTEMWYVLDAKEGAQLVYGFNRDISKDEFKRAIENNTLTDVLNYVNVKKGDLLFIESGTVHAIGEGILLAEIQQNSNCTYRVYDYGRLQNGKPRELHIQKALDVAVTKKAAVNTKADGEEETFKEFKRTLLKSCPLFTVFSIELNGKMNIKTGPESFNHILVLNGSGKIEGCSIKKGDSFFIPANYGNFSVEGKCELLLSEI